MRKLTAAAFVSLDGVMQAPGGPDEDTSGGFAFGGWTAPHSDAITEESMAPLFAGPLDLLLGRRTYDIWETYWPYQTDNPIGQLFNRAAKYVVTHSSEPLAWANSHALRDGADDVARVKESEGPDLVLWGSSTLYPGLLAKGLIDRLLLLTYPVVLGQGKRLLGDGAPPGAFRLLDSKVSSTGVLIATYEPAGSVPTGTFETQPPSEAELARRERWKREG